MLVPGGGQLVIRYVPQEAIDDALGGEVRESVAPHMAAKEIRLPLEGSGQ